MQISFVEPLSRAWERMRQILFEPFELAKWLVLGFSAWLAGLASGGGSGTAANGVSDHVERQPWVHSDLEHMMDRILDGLVWLPLVLLGILVVVGIVLAVLWISSRAKFIFLDNVVHNRAQIIEPWHRLQRIGDSLFLWRLGFVAVLIGGLLLVAALIFIPAASMSFNDVLRGLSFAGILVGVMTAMVVGVVAFFVLLFLENFVVPIMYKFELKATEAWRYFLPWLKAHGGWFLGYGLLVLLAAIALQLVVGVLCLLTCCIVLLPYVGTVILLPAWVLYRCYSIEFLAQFHPDFDLFLSAPLVPAPADGALGEPLDSEDNWPLTTDEE